jgi:hypothetical protein
MALYTITSLPIPPGYVTASPVKISDTGIIAGTCGKESGPTTAMIWDGGGYTLVGPAGTYSHAKDLNSNNVLVGNYEGPAARNIPFYWDKATATLSQINPPVQNSNGLGAYVMGINDNSQMTGQASQMNSYPPDSCVYWNGLNSIAVGFGNPNIISWGININNNGIIVGSVLNGADFQGFYGNAVSQAISLIPGSRGCIAINNRNAPQILFYHNTVEFRSYLMNTLTTVVHDLNIPGNNAFAEDINNNGYIVGETRLNGAVIWKGLTKINLNSPLITNAQINGWDLKRATSINNLGQIVGYGSLNGDVRMSPFLLQPVPRVPINQIPIAYTLPRSLWPGQAYDHPRPKGWPPNWPIPLPDPAPFELVGEAYRLKEDIQTAIQIRGQAGKISDKTANAAMKKITTQLISQQKQKLLKLVKQSWTEKRR